MLIEKQSSLGGDSRETFQYIKHDLTRTALLCHVLKCGMFPPLRSSGDLLLLLTLTVGAAIK